MGTAIVSIALSLDGHETLSRVVLAIAGAIWVTLALLLPLRAARDPARFRADARTPGALKAPVATAVLGTRLTTPGWAWAGLAMLVIAFVLWVALLGLVLAGWKSPTVGVSLLLAVSAESLAATLATSEHTRWLLIAALVPFGLGLRLYCSSSRASTSTSSSSAAATTGSRVAHSGSASPRGRCGSPSPRAARRPRTW